MTQAASTINPFYAARIRPRAPKQTSDRQSPVYAKLPRLRSTQAPSLTSRAFTTIHGPASMATAATPATAAATSSRTCCSTSSPAWCSTQWPAQAPAATCARSLPSRACRGTSTTALMPAIPMPSRQGEVFDFIWAHPAYWRQKLYADDPRDLSRAPTLSDFLRRYGQFIRNCANALKPNGKLAILMGDYCDREEGFVPLTFHTKRLAFARTHADCTDIIRFSHGASSSRKVYRSSFIPGLHDTCMVFEKTTSPKLTSLRHDR